MMGSRLATYLTSSIGKKNVMGVSGLLLCGFLLTHLAGNFLIMVSPDAFNLYGYKLTSNPLILPMELGLASLFLLHLLLGIQLTAENKMARPSNYAMKVASGRGATFASSTMPYTGAVILIFLISHLIHFRFGTVYDTTVGGVEMRDLHRIVMETFSNPLYAAWYVVAHIVLAIHVSHGFASCFQSLGFRHPRYSVVIQKFSLVYSVLVGLGFTVIVAWAYFQGVQ